MNVHPAPGSTGKEPPAPVQGGLRWQRRRPCLWQGGRPYAEPPPDKPEKPSGQPEPVAATGPCITSTPAPEARLGEPYLYQAVAYDAFTSGVTWAVVEPPAGMAVDRHSGRLSWIPETGGYVEITLSARTPYGHATSQTWIVCVRRPRRAAANMPCERFRAALRRKTLFLSPAGGPRRRLWLWRLGWRNGRGQVPATAPPEARAAVALPLRL